jgi:phosphotransferase system  glucose/maltose/N-acetylglucosamine-specific IIC component
MKTKHSQDTWLYAICAGLFAAQSFVISGDIPMYLAAPIGIAYAMVFAVKMKRSKGKDNE